MSLAMSETPCGPLSRHATVGVRVGEGDAAVTVGGGAPIVVQSMTNTDTADIEATTRQVAALGAGRLGAGADDRRSRRGRRGRAPHPRPPARARDHGAADRRLPLYRPQAARRASGLRRGARQISHQSRQCRLQEQARPAVRQDHRDRDPQRQAGAHRRQLGLARPGSSDHAHGRERGEREAARGRRGHARGDGAVGASVGGAGGGDRAHARSHHPVGEGLVGAGPHHRLSHARASAPITRCISA